MNNASHFLKKGRLTRLGQLRLLLFGLAIALPSARASALYQANFDNAELDKAPEDLLILDGGFAVKQEGDNKFLELPGAPLESFGLLFGPTEKDGLAVSATIYGTQKGRRFPLFGVGLNGVSGYKLLVTPAKKTVELKKGDEVKASVPYDWTPGQWTHLRLQLRKVKDGEWKIKGKVWGQSVPEPDRWLIEFAETEEPLAGRPSIWGSPYSGTPIRFDDLVVNRIVLDFCKSCYKN